jgi:hypothetical protein
MEGLVTEAKMPNLPIIRVVKADAASLHAHWPMVRRHLVKLKQKFAVRCPHVPINWIPEHFRFEAIKNIQGGFDASPIELFFACGHEEGETEETIQGFFITTREFDPALHLPLDLLIWIAIAWRPYVLEASLVQADSIARARGCIGIKHMSPFLAWGKRQRKMMARMREVYGQELAGQDWHMQYVVWRRSLLPEDE